ncbi:hypothetical protein D3C77_553130 [compost metagenome]
MPEPAYRATHCAALMSHVVRDRCPPVLDDVLLLAPGHLCIRIREPGEVVVERETGIADFAVVVVQLEPRAVGNVVAALEIA